MRFWLIAIAASVLTLGPLASEATAEVVKRSVSFEVENVNRSHVACRSDGSTYTVSGTLVAARAALGSKPQAVTLYLHGLGYGEFYWRFGAAPGYDFASLQAEAGHASVVVDQLGYDGSAHPDGREICVGSQADIAHQLVTALREGRYHIGARFGPSFARVALAGHSMGSIISQIEAYSFGEIEALVITAYADQGQTPLLASESSKTALVCASGSEAAEGGGPGGYAYFGQTPEDSNAMMYYDAEPAVMEAASALRNRDPCGLIESVPQALLTNQLELGSVKEPVLIVCAAKDALFAAEDPLGRGCTRQQDLYTGSEDRSTVVINETGHALTLERTRKQFHETVSDWMSAHGF
jgi:pimeloyl-ACP methyl ester carboxylesterase